jgi:hypothetical protein
MESESAATSARPPARVQRAIAPVLAAVVLHAALLAAYVAAYRGDLSALVCVDAAKIGAWPFEKIDVGFRTGGYDGQFCYAIARQPWTPASRDAVDLPSYRHVRILYPALAWMLTGGDPILLLGVLPALNLAAIAAVSWFGAVLARHYVRSVWWGFALPLILGIGMPVLRDLTDPVSAAAICGLLCAYLLEWSIVPLGLWAAAAMLSREQNAALVAAILLDALLRRRWGSAVILTAAVVGFAGWVLGLCFVYGEFPFSRGNIDVPFAGIRYVLSHLSRQHGRQPIVNLIGMLLLFVQLGVCVILLASRPQRLTALIALTGIALALLAGAYVYADAWSFVRVLIWLPLAIWLWSMESGRRWPVIVIATGAFWPISMALAPWLR